MSDYVENGPPCVASTDWTDFLNEEYAEIPEPTLEDLLTTSAYLASLDIKGSHPLMLHTLAIRYAEVVQANKDMYTAMSNEIARYRQRWMFERNLATDSLDEVADLTCTIELLKVEAESYEESFTTAQNRLDNALSMYDTMAPSIDWNELLK